MLDRQNTIYVEVNIIIKKGKNNGDIVPSHLSKGA